MIKKERDRQDKDTDQLTPLSTLIVGKEAEAFVAVTFQQHHTCRRTPVPSKRQRNKIMLTLKLKNEVTSSTGNAADCSVH